MSSCLNNNEEDIFKFNNEQFLNDQIVIDFRKNHLKLSKFAHENVVNFSEAHRIMKNNLSNSSFCDDLFVDNKIKSEDKVVIDYLKLRCKEELLRDKIKEKYPEFEKKSKEEKVELLYKGSSATPEEILEIKSKNNK